MTVITDTAVADKQRDVGAMSQWQLIRRRFARHRLAVASMYVLTALYLMALLAPCVSPYNPRHKIINHIYCPPQLPHWSWTRGLYTYGMKEVRNPISLTTHYYEDRKVIVPLSLFGRCKPYRLWGFIPLDRKLITINTAAYRALNPKSAITPTFFLLGADRYGRDMLSRIIFGSRISLSIGLLAIAISSVLGILIGGISGYFGGITDLVIQRIIEVFQSIPSLPLWIALGAIVPATWPPLWVYFGITIVLSLIGWTGLARAVRSKLLAMRDEDYALAARLLGASHRRVIFKHLVPGFTSHIIVVLSLTVPAMILGETALSFLGIGLRPPLVSWGVLLQSCMNVGALARHPWIIMPAVFVVLTVLSFNFVGDGLRDAADPYR